MQLTNNELIALSIVNNECDMRFNAKSYLNIASRLKACLNASYVSFSVHRFTVYIDYTVKGDNTLIKIKSNRSLLNGI